MKKLLILFLFFFLSCVTDYEVNTSNSVTNKKVKSEITNYKMSDFKLIKTLSDHSNYVASVSFSSDGRYFASGSLDNTAKIYNTNNWQLITTLRGHSN